MNEQKIKQLTDLKNDVLIDVNNPVKSLEKHEGFQNAEKEGLIPNGATNTQKVRIYSYILADKAKKLATELGYNPNDVKSLMGDKFGSNTPKMWWEQLKSLVVGSNPKEKEYVHTMAELQAIAPIAILNKNNLTLNEGYTSNLVSSFRKSVAPLFVRNQIATDEDRNALTKEAFNQAGVNQDVNSAYTTQQGNVDKESKTIGKTVSRTAGDIFGIGVKVAGINTLLGIPGQAIEMAVGKPVIQGLDKALSTSKEAQALEYTKLAETTTKTASEAKKVEDAKKVLDVAKVVTEKLPNNFLTRTIYGTLKSGVVHEIQGRVNDELKGFANFGVGSVNHLIGMPINTLGQVAIKMFGKEAPLFVEKVIQAAQSGTAMTATMAGMTVVNAARETEDMSAFKDVLDQHFGTKEKALRFVAENFLLGLALHAVNANTVSGLFKSKYDEGYSKLSPEEKAKVDDFVKDTNEKANDFETATKDAVEQVQKDDHKPLTTDKEIEDGINEFKDAESTAKLTDELYADNAKKAFIEGKINAFTMSADGLYLNTNGVRVVNGFKDNGNMDVFEASKVELTTEEKKELRQIEADRELGFEGTGERKKELAKKIFKRSLESSEALVSKAQPTSTTQSESNPALKEPSLDQQLQDINDGNTVTFEYKNESEVPEVFKGKISSKGETNGKPYVKVTMAKSLADFHLQEAPKSEAILSTEQQDNGNSSGVAGSKQDAKIESAVIEIGGKIYEGKNHAEAILKAKADGQDISQVNRQAEGKFKLSDGTIIDRAESKSRFGQDRSELMIPQDDNAKQANKDYAKITKNNEQQTTTNVEQKSVNNDSSGLSETSKNVESNTTNVESKGLSNESEVPIAEQKVSEEVTATKEETPTALRDVESTAKALENKLPDAYQANTRNQSTKDLIKWAEDIFDTKFEGDFEKGEYVSWFQSLGNEGYEAAGLLNTPKRALLKLKESPTYKGKAVESLLSKEQTPTDVKQKKAESEQGKLSDKDKIQQNATTEVQKQITEVEKIISELEDNPNSPFHKLVNLDEQKQKLSELQKKEAEVKKESAQPVLPETKAQKAANPRLSALPKKKTVLTEKVEEGVGNGNERDLDYELANNKTQVPEGKGSWRKTFNETGDAMRKKDILRAIAEISSDRNELNDILEATKGLPEGLHSEINYAVEHRLKSLAEKDTQSGIKEGTDLFPKDAGLSGKELVGDALDRIANKIGGKKNLTEQEKTSLIKDVTDLAKGLIQEGKATLDNVIDKIKEAIKKRFPDLDENDLNDISENIKQKVLFDEAFQWYKDNDYTYEEAKKELDDNDVDYNEKDLKAIFAEKKEKSVNEKRLQNRAFDGTTDEELKSIIEDYGLTYETESQIIAEKEANDIIEEVGLEHAFQAVQNGYIKGAQAAVVYAKMVDELDTKLADDKITDEERTRLKELQAYSVDIFDTEARDAGRFLAMLNRLYQKSLFTYDTMVKSATKTKGAPLTSEEKLQLKEQSEKIAEFDKKIKELEAKLDEERAQNAVKNIKALNNKPKTASFKAKAKALADKFRQLKSKPLVLKDADGNPIELTQNSIVSYNDIIELAAKAIEKTGELLDGINTALQEIKKQKWYQNLSQRDKDAVDRQVKEELLNLDTEVSDDKFKIPNSLLREIVRNGTEDIDGIVEKVLEVYGDIYPELKDDKRKVRDIITKYGETIESKEDLIGDKLALAKRIGRLLSAKDDLLSGKLPKKSGFQREKPGPTERLLMQEIQQLLKNVPKSQEELDALWATALDKAKNRVKNRIEELQLAIDKAEKINKSKNVQNYNDAGLDNLKAQLKEKQAEYDAAFPKEKSTLSDEQRLNQLINSKKKRLAKLEQQKIDKVYETNKKEGPDKSKFPELAKQIADLDAEIKKVTDDIKADETWKTHVEKKRLELAKKANQRRIDELKRRIDEKDFIVKKNPTPIDDELKQLRREKQKVADDYELAKHKFELENRSPTEKAVDGILDVLTLPKSLKATLDLSAPLRQGATVLLSNPQIFWNSFIKMHGQAFNEKTFEDSIDEIMKSDNYTLAQDSGLQITDPASADERKQDDQFTVKLVNKIPIFNKLNQGSARAYSGFLNNIRFSLFEQGVKELEAAGYKYEDNPKMFKALASTVNNLTGRGRSADGITGKFLNFILFSPKMITSRVLLLHDLMRTDIPFNSPSRKMAAKSLLGTAVYIGLFNLLGTVISNASGDDDDKDRKPNFNPVATDFLKVRSKQTTFDPTAGYAPLIRTAARIATEKSINSSGRETDLSKAYGSTRYAPAFDFFENKLSPTVSYLAAVTTHKNPDNKYESASEAEWYDYITGLVAPLQAMQVAENFNDKDKFGKDLLEVILGLYGIGVQQYDTSSKGKNNSRSSGSSSDSRGTER